MSDLNDLLQYIPMHQQVIKEIVQQLHEPHRHYHNLEHVLEMWRWHKEYNHGRFDNTLVACFCLYHDSICDPHAEHGANEQQSADLWMEWSLEVAPPIRHQVDTAILASADHFGNRCASHADDSCAICWCLDLDLLRLGSSNEQFTRYGHTLRLEHEYLSDLRWLQKSAEFRAMVMAQPRIFVHDLPQHELQARRNLSSALLRDWLALGYLHENQFSQSDGL